MQSDALAAKRLTHDPRPSLATTSLPTSLPRGLGKWPVRLLGAAGLGQNACGSALLHGQGISVFHAFVQWVTATTR